MWIKIMAAPPEIIMFTIWFDKQTISCLPLLNMMSNTEFNAYSNILKRRKSKMRDCQRKYNIN